MSDPYTFQGNPTKNNRTPLYSDDLNDDVRAAAGAAPVGIQRAVENRQNEKFGNTVGNNEGDGTDLVPSAGAGLNLDIGKGVGYVQGVRCVLEADIVNNFPLTDGNVYYTVYLELPPAYLASGANPPYLVTVANFSWVWNANNFPALEQSANPDKLAIANVTVVGGAITDVKDIREIYGYLQLKRSRVQVADFLQYGYTHTAIQNAINALPASGGKVYIPEGTWTIGSSITISADYVTIEGAGYGTYLTGDFDDGIIIIDGDFVTISDIRFNNDDNTFANGSNGSSCILLNSGDYPTIKNCYFYNSVIQVHLNNSDYFNISHNRFFDPLSPGGGDQSAAIAAIDGTSSYGIISNNVIVVSAAVDFFYHGIGTSSAIPNGTIQHTVISGNIIKGASVNSAFGQFGILNAKSYNTITGNRITGFVNAGGGVGTGIWDNAATETSYVGNNLVGNDANLTTGAGTPFYLAVTDSDPLNNV